MTAENETNVVRVTAEHGHEVELASKQDPFDIVRAAEARAEIIGSLVPKLLKACHKSDIQSFGDKPFVADSGCQKIARAVGISFGEPLINATWSGDCYDVVIDGVVSVFGQAIPVTGGCSSADGFISGRSNLTRSEMMLEVRKKALANWRGNGVRHLLGLNGLSWDDLSACGFSRDNATQVDFKKGKSSGISDDGNEVRDKIRAAILDCVNQNKTAAKELLRRMTEFEGKNGTVAGKDTVDKLSDKQAYFLWKKIKDSEADWEKHLSDVLREFVVAKNDDDRPAEEVFE